MEDDDSIRQLEERFAAARERFGELVVARGRGVAVDEAERAYRDARTAIAIPAPATPLFASMSGTLAWMDELEPDPADASDGVADGLRAATMEAYGEAAASIELPGRTVDRLTALELLATDPDAASRRATFLAMAPIWEAVDGDGGVSSPYRRLVRESAARWARDGSPIEAAAIALGMTPDSIEGALRSILEAWRTSIGARPVEPWDYRFLVGEMDRALSPLIPRDRLREITESHLRSLGADPAALGIRFDIDPYEGRPALPVAFTISSDVARRRSDGSWQPATPWIFATYHEGGLGNLEELVHEAGHALHYAAIRTRPAFFEPPVEAGGFVEGIADLVGWDVTEPAFQERHLGASVDRRTSRLGRYGRVMLDICWALFELELHRHPERRPNDVWAELTEWGLGIVPHPEWSWWAVRGQLIEAPGYMANYALSAIVAAALRARISEVRGDWLDGDASWYPWVSKHLLRFGAERPVARVLEDVLGQPLTADALLADLRTVR